MCIRVCSLSSSDSRTVQHSYTLLTDEDKKPRRNEAIVLPFCRKGKFSFLKTEERREETEMQRVPERKREEQREEKKNFSTTSIHQDGTTTQDTNEREERKETNEKTKDRRVRWLSLPPVSLVSWREQKQRNSRGRREAEGKQN